VSALGSHTPSQPPSPPSSQPLSPPPPPFDFAPMLCVGPGPGGGLSSTQPSGPCSHTPTSFTPRASSASHLPLPACSCIPQLYVACPAQRALAVPHHRQCVNTLLNGDASTDRWGRIDKIHGDWGVGVKEAARLGTVITTNRHNESGTRGTYSPPGDGTQHLNKIPRTTNNNEKLPSRTNCR
jgi:hypothetical protein